MRATPLFALLIVSATLAAQVKKTASPAPSTAYPPAMSVPVKLSASPAVLLASPNGSRCPIGISAERRSAASVSTVGSTSAALLTQGIQLRFEHLLTPGIETVTVVLHGLNDRPRIMPAGSGGSGNVEETFELTRAAQAASLSASYVQPKRVFTTRWIELTSVGYTDGTVWYASPGARCTVTPSNFVLVSAR